jgi:thymidylate synthase (FAD)
MEDYLTSITTTEIPVLDHGRVHLIDCHPRLCPPGYTPEFRIVEAARVSFGGGLKTPEEDRKLIRYLYNNQHTSPLEMCSVTFALKIPKAVAIQLYRHRTSTFSHFNEFSQRYAECDETQIGVYNPLDWRSPSGEYPGIRSQCTVNKQSSVPEVNPEKRDLIIDLMTKANEHQAAIHHLYHQMIAAGCAKEIARFWLPMSEYTIMYVQYDLNNLLKMLALRDEAHTQYETQVVARAMHDLAAQCFPTVFTAYRERIGVLTLLPKEVEAIQKQQLLSTTSVSDRRAFQHKLMLLGLKSAD